MWQLQWMLQLIPDSIFIWITYLLFATGVLLYVASKLVGWLPIIGRYRLDAELSGVVALVVAAYFYGGIGYREMVAEMKEIKDKMNM
jgi:ABC-type antimicrobial peptide transport system permease subunit